MNFFRFEGLLRLKNAGWGSWSPISENPDLGHLSKRPNLVFNHDLQFDV
jgi:hypothetical protein